MLLATNVCTYIHICIPSSHLPPSLIGHANDHHMIIFMLLSFAQDTRGGGGYIIIITYPIPLAELQR